MNLWEEYKMVQLRLKELLEEYKISPENFAVAIGMSAKARVYEWLRDCYIPNFESIIKIADYFKCSIEYLLSRSEDNSQTKFKKIPPFDTQLKNIMKLKKVSQYRMVKDKVINPNQFSMYFKRKLLPSIDTLIRLADYFNISVDELVGRV